mgnify:CR=1 FL=1
MTQYNFYFGTRDGKLKYKYRYTSECKNDNDANKELKNAASSFYYKYEGTHNIPSFKQVALENELTGVPVERLYDEHIKDLIISYWVPTELDTIPSKDLIEY